MNTARWIPVLLCGTALFGSSLLGQVPRDPAVTVASGPWSAPATWKDGHVPGEGVPVRIAKTDTVTFDADLSAMATGIGPMAIEGVLRADVTKSTCLKMAGDITGPGGLFAGSPQAPMPRDVSFTLQFAPKAEAGGQTHYCISGLGQLGFYSYDPVPRIADLSLDARKATTPSLCPAS